METTLESLASCRKILNELIGEAYDNDDVELYDTLFDARRVIENKLDALQGL